MVEKLLFIIADKTVTTLKDLENACDVDVDLSHMKNILKTHRCIEMTGKGHGI